MDSKESAPAVKSPSAAVDWVRCGLGVLVVALVVYAFWVRPVEKQPLSGMFTTYTWLRNQWNWPPDNNYSHGPLIPFIALGLVVMRRRELAQSAWEPLTWGSAVAAAAMGLYWLGIKGGQPRIVIISFVMLLHGLALALGGRGPYRLLFFPITFLLLMIPLTFLDNYVGFPLRVLMARTAAWVLNAIGIETLMRGTGLVTQVYSFDVANPCSGIRSLMALTTVTAAFGYVTQREQWKRWLLFLSAIPLAVLGNVARVVGIALVGQVYGAKAATELHDTAAGFIVYGVALVAMVSMALLLNLPVNRIVQGWLKPVTEVKGQS